MINDAEPNEALWDASDVARYLKASRSWVYHQAEAGRLPHLRIGGLLRFDAPTVKAFASGETAHGGKVLTIRPRSGADRR